MSINRYLSTIDGNANIKGIIRDVKISMGDNDIIQDLLIVDHILVLLIIGNNLLWTLKAQVSLYNR